MAHRATVNIPALIDASLHDIGDPIILDGNFDRMAIMVANTGANLTGFSMLVRPSYDNATYQTYLTTTGWDSAAGTLKKVLGTIKTLASGSVGFADVDIGPVYAVKFQASIASGARNTGTLTLTDNAVEDETVTIGTKVYTWRETVSTTANQVLIGATASDSLDNLIAAINGTNDAGQSGTLYGSATVAHTQVAAAAGASDTMDVTALDTISNAVGTLIATTETMTAGSWGATTLADGVTTSVTVGVIASKS